MKAGATPSANDRTEALIPEDIVPLVTKRLILRLVEESDAAAIHSFRSDPNATRYLSHEPLTWAANGERLSELLALRKASTGAWFNYGWAITLRESGDVIGDARTWNSTALTAAGRHGWYLLEPA